MDLCLVSRPILPWEDELQWFVCNSKGKKFSSYIRKICLAATIYVLWRERCLRLHEGSIRNAFVVTAEIVLTVRLRLISFRKIPPTDENKALGLSWNVLSLVCN